MTLPLAGAKILAADLAAIFPQGVDAWTPFTPTVIQGVAVTVTATQARYTRVGRLIVANYALSCTSTGTAANQVRISVPVTANSAALVGIGNAMIFDTSATIFWSGTAVADTSTTFKISSYNAGNFLGGAGFTAALASGDIISASICYEAAS